MNELIGNVLSNDAENLKSSSADESSDDEEDDLILEGEVNDSELDTSSDEGEDDDETTEPAKKKIKSGLEEGKRNVQDVAIHKKISKKEQSLKNETLQVEFIFCDMNKKYFQGIRTLLSSHSIHVAHASDLSDLIIDNISVGTVVSVEHGDDDVFGFASILNYTTNAESPCIQQLKKHCIDNCPKKHLRQMREIYSGTAQQSTGFLIHSRMINMPLIITEVLHQQLVLDLDWTAKDLAGSKVERQNFDFHSLVLMAPWTAGPHGSLLYKYFEDEIFAEHAEFCFTFDAPKVYHSEEKEVCSVILLTKEGHRQGLADIKQMIGK